MTRYAALITAALLAGCCLMALPAMAQNEGQADLEKALGVVAQFKILQGQLISMPASESLDEGKGVRVSEEIVQLGLTKAEINGVFNRIEKLLKRVDSGKIKTF